MRFTYKKMSKLGRKGGMSTKKHKGKAHFRKISLMRKHFRGGRKPLPKLEAPAT